MLRKVLVIGSLLVLIVSLGLLAGTSQTNLGGKPQVTNQGPATVKWQIDPWLEFKLTTNPVIDFGLLQNPGTYTSSASTNYVLKTNYQGKINIAAKYTTVNNPSWGWTLKIDEKWDSSTKYTYTWAPGFCTVSSSYGNLAQYSHSGELVDFAHRGSAEWLCGHFNYQLILPNGQLKGKYQIEIRYQASCV